MGSNNDNAIGGGKALGDENNNQQTTGVRVMMAMGNNNARGEGGRHHRHLEADGRLGVREEAVQLWCL